jgi:hypothetical protein
MRHLAYFTFAAMVAWACSSKTTSPGTTGSATTPSGKYSEDLSVLRPKAGADTAKQTTKATQPGKNQQTKYVEAKYAVNETLDTVLDSISEQNLQLGLVDGFTIQVYSGLKREEALNVKKQMATTLPGVEAEVQYAQPNFRVRVGKYYDRYDAQQDYQLIKKHFPNAIILPERVPINP